MIVAQALRMSPRPVPGGAAPVAPDAPAPHVLRARVVDRQSPRHAPGVVPEAWREEAGGWWYAEDSNHHDDHDDR